MKKSSFRCERAMPDGLVTRGHWRARGVVGSNHPCRHWRRSDGTMARQGFLKRMSAALFAAAALLMIGSALLDRCMSTMPLSLWREIVWAHRRRWNPVGLSRAAGLVAGPVDCSGPKQTRSSVPRLLPARHHGRKTQKISIDDIDRFGGGAGGVQSHPAQSLSQRDGERCCFTANRVQDRCEHEPS